MMRRRYLNWAMKFLRLAGSFAWMGSLLAWALRRWGDRMPVERIMESEHLQAFRHPQPNYATHILIIPKDAIKSLMSVTPDQIHIWQELMAMVQALVGKLGLEDSGYRLIVNGGPYQEFPQLHFHLVSGPSIE